MKLPQLFKPSVKTIAEELIPVVPMSAPSGLTSYVTYSYEPSYTSNSIFVDVWDENIFDQDLTLEQLSQILRQRVNQPQQVEGEVAPTPELAPFKTKTSLGAGYVYAPYVAVTTTEITIPEGTFKPKDMVKSKYATKSINSKYYGLFNVTE